MDLFNFPIDIIIRTTSVYLFLIVGLLIFGKKELSQLSITDLVFILLISNSVQNAMVGKNSDLSGGIMAAAILFLLNYLFRRLNFRYKFFRKILEGEPVALIYQGKVIQKNLTYQQITDEEIHAAIRAHGLNGPEDVSLGMLEIDGSISIISFNETKKTNYVRKRKQKMSKRIG